MGNAAPGPQVGDVLALGAPPRPYVVAVSDLGPRPRRVVLVELYRCELDAVCERRAWSPAFSSVRQVRATTRPDFVDVDLGGAAALGRMARADLVALLGCPGALCELLSFQCAPLLPEDRVWRDLGGGSHRLGARDRPLADALRAERWRLEHPARVIQRAWRAALRRLDERRRRAAALIEAAWLHACYAPGGPGWRRARKRYSHSSQMWNTLVS
jgi:hypothetical protein